MLQKYRASGRCGSMFSLVLLGMFVAAGVAGWVYQYVIELIPFVYLNGLVMVGFGFALYVGLAKAQAFGRCRSARAALVGGLLVATAALASSHVAAYFKWRGAVLDDARVTALREARGAGIPTNELSETVRAYLDEVRPLLTPAAYVEYRVEAGWVLGTSNSGVTLGGIVVWLAWLIEAAAFLAAGVLGARALEGIAFCEACGRWVDTLHGRIRLANPTRADLKRIREADEAADLFPTGEVRFREADSHLVHLWKACDGCGQGFLDVQVLTYTYGEKGEVKTETETLHANLLVDAEVEEVFHAAAAVADAQEKDALTPRRPRRRPR